MASDKHERSGYYRQRGEEETDLKWDDAQPKPEFEQADYSNPFMFDKCYPGYYLSDYNLEQVYHMGVYAGGISEKELNRRSLQAAKIELLERLDDAIFALDADGSANFDMEDVRQVIGTELTKERDNG